MIYSLSPSSLDTIFGARRERVSAEEFTRRNPRTDIVMGRPIAGDARITDTTTDLTSSQTCPRPELTEDLV